MRVEFFCYHRDRAGSMTLRGELRERHWSYMDGYAAEMIARGPTLTDDGETATGSVHILGLPDPGLGAGPAADLPAPPGQDEMIAYGPLLSDDGAMLTTDRYADIEVHSWQFGGRPA